MARRAGGQLQAHAGVRGEQGQERVRGRGGPELHAVEGGEGPEQVTVALFEALGRPAA